MLAEAKNGEWSALVTRSSPSGMRHVLDGEDVHCGVSLLLQAVEDRDLPGDYGNTYLHPLDRGRLVRYEASFDVKRINALLYTEVDGHSFATRLEGWMRFRWPPSRR